jgi:hypothetical protein
MFLSNRPTLVVQIAILALFLASCGSGPANSNNSVAVLHSGAGEFPFSTIEPETFQANFIVTADGSEKQWFLARSNDRRRFDIFENGRASLTQLRTDKVYLIDHLSRTFAEEPQGTGTFDAPDPILSGSFRGKEYHEFEDLGNENGRRKYRVRAGDDSRDDIIILIDEASGMIVRQEFYEGTGEQARIALTYEVRDLKLNVDDTIFSLPADYRRVVSTSFSGPEASSRKPH